jgi:hypothetical protein
MVRPDGQVKQAVNEKYIFEITLAIAASMKTRKYNKNFKKTAEIVWLCKQGDKPSREFYGALQRIKK